MSNADIARQLGIGNATFYRWKRAGLTPEEMRELARLGKKLMESEMKRRKK